MVQTTVRIPEKLHSSLKKQARKKLTSVGI